ncbi:unnamed protein product [Malus baccata var. baccata]
MSSTTSSGAPQEYEFSCSNTPNYPFHLMGKRRHHNNRNNFFTSAHAQLTQDDEMATAGAVKAVLEMLNNDLLAVETVASVAASPVLPGFGKSPMVHQLRITDSPFPLRETDEDSHVDKAAEEFIEKFYKNLWKRVVSAPSAHLQTLASTSGSHRSSCLRHIFRLLIFTPSSSSKLLYQRSHALSSTHATFTSYSYASAFAMGHEHEEVEAEHQLAVAA